MNFSSSVCPYQLIIFLLCTTLIVVLQRHLNSKNHIFTSKANRTFTSQIVAEAAGIRYTDEILPVKNYELYKYIISGKDHCLYFLLDDYASKKCAITFKEEGTLCNMMGQYATLLALSFHNERPAVLRPGMSHILSAHFKISLPVLPQNSYVEWTHYYLYNWMEERYKNLEGQYVSLHGQVSSWTFFHKYRRFIKREFTLHDDQRERAQNVLKELQTLRMNGTSVIFIGVHVKRGDLAPLMKYLYKGVLADAGYFTKATDYFRRRYPNCVFVVSSDDIQWCQQHIDVSHNDIYFLPENNNASVDSIDDLAILMNCNHSIITFGAFGFWAAYLAGGETVYITNFTSNDSLLLGGFKYEAFYLPKWIPISANLTA